MTKASQSFPFTVDVKAENVTMFDERGTVWGNMPASIAIYLIRYIMQNVHKKWMNQINQSSAVTTARMRLFFVPEN